MFDLETEMARKGTSRGKPLMEQLNVRVPPELIQALQDAHRVQVLLAEAAGEEAPDFSKSIRRFWRIGIDVTFDKVGGRPQSETDWKALEATLATKKTH